MDTRPVVGSLRRSDGDIGVDYLHLRNHDARTPGWPASHGEDPEHHLYGPEESPWLNMNRLPAEGPGATCRDLLRQDR